jgi:hypothetical protein
MVEIDEEDVKGRGSDLSATDYPGHVALDGLGRAWQGSLR